MLFKSEKFVETYKLNAESIDCFSERITEILQEIGAERANILRIRLSLEEALLRFRDRFGEEADVTLTVSKGYNRMIIQIENVGDAFNPLSEIDSELEDWSGSLLTAVGLSPQYTYTGRANLLRLYIPIRRINPFIKLLVGLVGGIIFGILGLSLAGDSLIMEVVTNVMDPIYEFFSRILSLTAGPIIFFMVMNTVLNMGKVEERGGDGKRIIGRYLALSFGITLLAFSIIYIVFSTISVADRMDTEEATGLFTSILDVVPNDIVTPFIESNSPQLIILAVFLGNALNVIGAQGKNLARIVRQMNMVGLTVAEFVSNLVPFFVFILVALEIWIGATGILVKIWRCLLFCAVVGIVWFAIVLLYTSKKEGVNAKNLFKALLGPFRLTILTGSLDASYGESETTCSNILGINKNFVRASIPHGLVMYMPMNCIGAMSFSLFVAMYHGIEFSVSWFATLIVLSVLLSVAAPPVPGVDLLAYIVIFAQLGIPKSAMIDAMIFDVLYSLIASAGNQIMLEVDLVLQADKMGVLNKNILHKLNNPSK